MPDKDNFGAVLQPVGYRWQNDRDGLVEDGTAPACRASAGSSGFHEMNHPVVVQQPVPFTKAKRAQSTTDDETWVDGKVNPTLSLFDQGDTRATTVAVAFDWQKGNDVNNPRPSTMNVAVEHSQTIGTTRTPAVAFTPGNLARGAGPSPNAEVAPTQRCSAGRGADDQRTCVAMVGTDLYNGAITGDVAATMGTPGSSVNASGPTVMAFAQNQVGEVRTSDVSGTINTNSNASGRNTPMAEVAHALRGEGFDASEDGTGRGTPLVPQAMTVRRLLPIECERLQAFPDNWTLIPWRGKPAEQCPDGPRYKALGNSMACNCMAWIGERIAAVEDTHA